MSYTNWEKRLKNITVPTHEQPYAEDEGYYRKPITKKLTNGRNKITDFIPVAVFLDQADNKTLVVHIGAGDNLREIDTPEAIADADFWTWCCRYPITHQAYNDALAGKPWPDLTPIEKAIGEGAHVRPAKPDEKSTVEAVPAANREVARTDNLPPDEPVEELPPSQVQAKAIDDQIARSPLKIVNDAEAAAALGNKNKLAELRLTADKDGKAIYEPPYREYKRLHGEWTPMVKRADDHEKKLNTAILTYRESERKRLKKIADDKAAADAKIEQERLAEIARLEEINQRAADRAIIAGEEIPEPLVPEDEIGTERYSAVPDPEPLAPAPLVATYGSRKIKEEVKLILDAITDQDAVYTFLRDDPKLKALLLELATAKVKAGLTVPGTKTREGLI